MKNNRFCYLFLSLFILLTSCIVSIGASDVTSEVAELGEPYLEPEIHTIVSYDGTTLFEDLIIDDEIVRNPYLSYFDEVISNAFPFYVEVPGASTQTIFINKDRECSISFLKNIYAGELMHGIKVSTYYDDGSELQYLFFYPNMSIDDYQGFSRANWEYQLFCRPSYNVSLPNGLPAYTAESPQVYFTDYYEPEDYVYVTDFTYYAIPTYAGRFTVRDWSTGSIYINDDQYLKIGDIYNRQFLQNVGSNYIFISEWSRFNQGESFYKAYDYLYSDVIGFSLSQGGAPYLLYDSNISSNVVLYPNGTSNANFPKYYSENYSDIKTFLITPSQYEDYLNSDQKFIDDLNKSKEEYNQSSDEFKEYVDQYRDIPKPDISDVDLTLSQDVELGIASINEIYAVMFNNTITFQMLIISLTFVLVSYILFGKR